MNARKIIQIPITAILIALATLATAQDTLKVDHIQAILYTGNGPAQPLVVGLGGSEGGNAWASNHWRSQRETFLAKGYAFLAIGYFGGIGTPKLLDQISINQVYSAIAIAKKHAHINGKKIAVIGGSRGADLALLLGSYYSDISCIIAMSASHVAFPGHTREFTTSAWSYQHQQLPFVPVNDAAVPHLIKGDLSATFSAMLQDSIAEKKAMIPIERIRGAILLLSGNKDEIIPAAQMAEKMIFRLKKHHFAYPFQHIALEGDHAEPTRHFDQIFRFLAVNFPGS